MKDFFFRNLHKKTGKKVDLPAYLKRFTYVKEDKQAYEDCIKFFKTGELNLQTEEQMLGRLSKAIG
jgi:hypothetical protein